MVSNPNSDTGKPFDATRIAENIGDLHKIMKEFEEEHQELFIKASQINAAAEDHDIQKKMLKHRIDLAQTMSENIQALDTSQIREIQSIAEILSKNDFSEQLEPLQNNHFEAIEALHKALENDWQPTVSGLENAAAASEAYTQPLLDVPLTDAQPATPERDLENASPEELMQRLVELDVVEVCPECERPYFAGNMHYVDTNDGSTSEHDEVCHNCHGSDIGFQ